MKANSLHPQARYKWELAQICRRAPRVYGRCWPILLALCSLLFLGCQKEREAPVKYTTELRKAQEKAEHSKNVADKAILKAAINSYYSREGRYPASLEELRPAGFLQSVPSGWEYDPATGEIK